MLLPLKPCYIVPGRFYFLLELIFRSTFSKKHTLSTHALKRGDAECRIGIVH